MSKRADGAAAARDDDDASPSGKSDDDEGSSGDGEPSSPLEPSEAFKRPRLASDARKPLQTRAREPRPLPKMVINPDVDNIYSFCYDDFELQNYDPHPSIKAPIAV